MNEVSLCERVPVLLPVHDDDETVYLQVSDLVTDNNSMLANLARPTLHHLKLWSHPQERNDLE